jgi:hypothetical protein
MIFGTTWRDITSTKDEKSEGKSWLERGKKYDLSTLGVFNTRTSDSNGP